MTPAPCIASIVEGHGEAYAVPELLRRIATDIYGGYVHATKPHRVPKSSMVKGPELHRAVRLQAGRLGGHGGLIVLADADGDDPAVLCATLQRIADEAVPSTAVAVVAVKEYEAWFLAGIESLRTHRSVRDDAHYDDDPERRRNCKKELELLMTESYSETRHQVAFSSLLDLDAASQRSPSLRTLIDAVGGVLCPR